MKSQRLIVFALAVLLMAAAPPIAPRPAAPSWWSRIVAGAKQFVHDPLGSLHSPPRSLPPEPDLLDADNRRAGSALAPPSPALQRDALVRPAAAVEKVTPPAAPLRKPQKTAKRSLFSRNRSPSRTVSEYMAEEKP